MSNGKLIFADLIRIVAMLLVVFWHVIANMPNEFEYLKFGFWFYNLISVNIGSFAVTMFFFISGVSLQYNYPAIQSIPKFYIKRLIRIYPALWLSVLFGLVIIRRDAVPINDAEIIWSLSGIFALFRATALNSWTWFLGTIILFYFLFPFLSSAISKRPFLSMAVILSLSASSRYLLNVHPLNIAGPSGFIDCMMANTFPLSNLFTFSLGIFSIQRGIFPEKKHNIMVISFISTLTYPIYLIHGFLLGPYMALSETFAFKVIVIGIYIYILDALIQRKARILFK